MRCSTHSSPALFELAIVAHQVLGIVGGVRHHHRDRLRARRVDVLTALDCGMAGKSDEEHLRRASSDGRVLYSFNIKDYSRLHEQWIASGREHFGIILAFQQRYSIGEQLRRLLHLLNLKPAAEMLSRLEYLSNWGR